MLKKVALAAGVTLLALMMILSLAPHHASAKGGGGGGGKEGRVRGTITAVDMTGGTLTVNGITLQVTSATQMRKDSKKNITLAQIAVGDTADARYGTKTMIASRIDVKSPKVQGKITAIDLGAQTVTIQRQNGATVTVQVVASTKIERNDVKATLAEFEIGDRGEAIYNAQTMIASKIEATGN